MIVWDRAVRILHWVLVGAVALSAASTLVFFSVHQPAGYVALAAVLIRCVWGCSGAPRTSYSRFAQFIRGPRATSRYLRQLARNREPRYIGHNPLGGWMVIALMVCVTGLAITGWLYTTDALWGNETVEDFHRALAWTMLALVAMHVAGVVFTSFRHRENLVASMFSGKKREPRDADIA
jgi:cytochrome b